MMSAMIFVALYQQHHISFNGETLMFGRWEEKYSPFEAGKKSINQRSLLKHQSIISIFYVTNRVLDQRPTWHLVA